MSDVDVPISYRGTQTGDKEHAPLEDPVLPAIAAGADCYVVKLFAAGVIDWDSFRQGPVEVDAGMMSAMAALLKFASYLARRRPEGWAVSAASLIGDAAMAWA